MNEKPGSSGDGAGCHEEGAWYEDRVQQLGGDLAVMEESVDFGEGASVVGGDGSDEQVDRGEKVCA